MELNSYEIDNHLFNKQMSLYNKIDNLINKKFDELDPDILSVLTRTLMDLDDRIKEYNKVIKNRDMFNVDYDRVKKEREKLREVDSLKLKTIMKECKFHRFSDW
jgi:hypothetical protein